MNLFSVFSQLRLLFFAPKVIVDPQKISMSNHPFPRLGFPGVIGPGAPRIGDAPRTGEAPESSRQGPWQLTYI